jgi:hypothetical protein
MINAPKKKPEIKNQRQSSLGRVIKLVNMPLKPHIFPSVNMSKDAETPIKRPPTIAGM